MFALVTDQSSVGHADPYAPKVRWLCPTDVRPTLDNDLIEQATEVQPARSRYSAVGAKAR
jgi:hypothetical protein